MSGITRIMPTVPIEAVLPVHRDAWLKPVWIIKDADGDDVA